MSPGGQTALRTEVAGPTARPGSQNTHGIEAGGPTATSGGQTAKPCVTPSSPNLTAPRGTPMTSVAPPRGGHYSTRATHDPSIHDSNNATHGTDVPALSASLFMSLSTCAGATSTASTSAVAASEGHIGGTSSQPSFDDHTSETRLPTTDRQTHTLSATSALTLLPVPSSVRVALVDPNRRRTMKEEFAALIANNTCDLVPHPVGSNIITDKWIFKLKFNYADSLK
jgi:hypothetical protein